MGLANGTADLKEHEELIMHHEFLCVICQLRADTVCTYLYYR